MKAMLYLAALLPLSVMAQPINIDNNPNQPGYVVPSQQRMQNQMQTQQMQQQNNLKQSIQSQSRAQQQHLQTQLNNDRQRVQQNNNLTVSSLSLTPTVGCCSARRPRKGRLTQKRITPGSWGR
ncbi:outer membrane protein [Klebsiella michiganensis]|nr:outer membrane protein [Klebsiella michiganensis]